MADGKDKPKSPAGADGKPSSLTETDGIDWFIMSDFNDLLSGNSTTLKPNPPSQPQTQPKTKPSSPNQGNPFINNEDEDDAAWLAELDLDAPAVSDLSFTGNSTGTVLAANHSPSAAKPPAKDITQDTTPTGLQSAKLPSTPPEATATDGIDWLILSNLEEPVSGAGSKNSNATDPKKTQPSQPGSQPSASLDFGFELNQDLNFDLNPNSSFKSSLNSSLDLDLDWNFDGNSSSSDQFLKEFGSGLDDELPSSMVDQFLNEAALENPSVGGNVASNQNAQFAELIAEDAELNEELNDDLAFLLADEPQQFLGNDLQQSNLVSGDDLVDLNDEADDWLESFSDADLNDPPENSSAAPQNLAVTPDQAKNLAVKDPAVKDPVTAKNAVVLDPLTENISDANSLTTGDDLAWQNAGDLAPWDQPVQNPAFKPNALEVDPLDTAVVFDFNQFDGADSHSQVVQEIDDWLNPQAPAHSAATNASDVDEFGDMVWHIPSSNDDDFGDTVVSGWIDPSERIPKQAKATSANKSSTNNDGNTAKPNSTLADADDPFATNWDSDDMSAVGAKPQVDELKSTNKSTNVSQTGAGQKVTAQTITGQTITSNVGLNPSVTKASPQPAEPLAIAPVDAGNPKPEILDEANLANMTYELGAQSFGNDFSSPEDMIGADMWQEDFDDILAAEDLSTWDSAQFDGQIEDQSNYLDTVANELFQDAPSVEEFALENYVEHYAAAAVDLPAPAAMNATVPNSVTPPPLVNHPANSLPEPSHQLTTLYDPNAMDVDGFKNSFDSFDEGLADVFDQGLGSDPGQDFDQLGDDLAGYADSYADGSYQNNYQNNHQNNHQENTYQDNYQAIAPDYHGMGDGFDDIAVSPDQSYPDQNYADQNYLDQDALDGNYQNQNYPPLNHPSSNTSTNSPSNSGVVIPITPGPVQIASSFDYQSDYGDDGLNLDPYAATQLEVDLADFNAVLADDFVPTDYVGTGHNPNLPQPPVATGLISSKGSNFSPSIPAVHNIPSPSNTSSLPFSQPVNPSMGNTDNDYLDNFDLDEFDSSIGSSINGLSAPEDDLDANFSPLDQPNLSAPVHNPLPLPPLPKMPPLPPLPHSGNRGTNQGNPSPSSQMPPRSGTPMQPPAPHNPHNNAQGHSQSMTGMSTGTTITPPLGKGNSNGNMFDDDFLRNGGRGGSAPKSSGMDTGFNMGGGPVLSDFNDIGALDIRDDTDWTGLLDGDSELSDSFTAMPISSYGAPRPDQSGFFTGETDDLPRHRQPPLVPGNTGLTGFGTGPRPTPTPQLADNFRPPYAPGQTIIGNTAGRTAKEGDRPNLPVSISLEAIWDKAKWPVVGLILLLIGGGGMMILQRPYTELGLKLGFIKDASGKNLQGANFKDAKLENVNFSGANLEAAVFENANLKGADLSDAKLDGVNFAKANLRGTRLLRTSIVWANFKGAQLNLADLEGADVNRSNFATATLQGANLRGMKLGEGDKMARLEPRDRLMWQLVNEPKPGRNLAGQNLMGFNLNGAVLTGANLTNSQLSFVDLTGADLKNANLSGATVKGMNLSGAKLNGAQFAGAVWDKDKPPKTDAATVCPNGKPGPCKF